MIVTKPGVTWSFACDYDTEYEVGQDLTVNAASISQGFSQTNAQFAFAFDFFTDGSFQDVQDTAEYSVGQQINFGGKSTFFRFVDQTDGPWSLDPSLIGISKNKLSYNEWWRRFE